MGKPRVASYGSWRSPINAEVVVESFVSPQQIAIDGDDVYWVESRSMEGGRSVIVRRAPDGSTEDLTPEGYDARTRAHEYGGGAYLADRGTLYFSNMVDQRVYRQAPGAQPEPITLEAPLRYADAIIDRTRSRLIAVREDHTGEGEPTNTLVAFPLDGGEQRVLVSGNDFYSSPRLSPDESRLAWLSWNHPNMPWDGTELWAGTIADDGLVTDAIRVAGGSAESIFQPEWSPDGTLCFVSDATGWWNLYRWLGGPAEAILSLEAEFGSPQWVFGKSLYGFASPGSIVCAYRQGGTWRLGQLEVETGELSEISTPYDEIWQVRVGDGFAIIGCAAHSEPASIVQIDLGTHDLQVLRRGREVTINPEYFSMPEVVEFPTSRDRTAYAYFYPPANPDFAAPEGEKPPLLVMIHGGPTSATSTGLRYGIQYWTSRGIAVLDVDYGGSTGYGRAYRERLNGEWGVVDVDDCVHGALYLADRGSVNRERMAMTGGSAGGFTTLAALTFREPFSAGASYYGVSDMEALAVETHKFESHYLDSLVGPYPEMLERYHERSPIYHVDQLERPVIFFQGLDDQVVPPDQSERMHSALRQKGIPTAYLAFEGERHGFRRAETQIRSLEAELYFYSRIFGFELADGVEPVTIDNL